MSWSSVPLLLLALLGAAAPPPPHGAGDVAVVYTGEGDAVRAILTGVRKRLGEKGGAALREVRSTDANAINAMREQRPGVILAVGTQVAERMRREFATTPTVAMLVSRNEPAGATSAITTEIPLDVQVQWLRKLLPSSVKRIGIVYSPANEAVVARLSELAKAVNLRIVAKSAPTPGDIPQALAGLASSADVLWGIPDDVVMTPETARSILLYSMRNRIPLVGQSTAWVKAGALLALDRDYVDIGMQGAEQALRLVAGESAANVRSESPRRIVYAVNTRTAEALGVTLDAEVVRGAREVHR